MKSTAYIAFLLGATVAFAAEGPAPAPRNEFKEQEEKKSAALDALRKGESANANNLLRQAARGAAESAVWSLDYADLLVAAAIDLKDRNEYKASTDYFHQAAREMEKALKAKDAPSDASTVAAVYYKLGFITRVADADQKKANDYFQKAVEAEPSNEDGRRALQRSKEGRQKLDALDKKSSPGTPKTGGG